jgi:anionic cell wall polymer biosynthesis LytR-Cps2A-Psr (LCP) family protein
MREVFGLEVDGVIVVNMQQFESFVDQQGGIVLIPHANVSDRCGDDEYTYQADVAYQLNGHDLLCYARMRWHSPHGYFDRQIRHFDVLQAFVNSLLQKILDDPVATYQMLDAVVDTDFESGLDVMLETVYAYLLAGQQFTLDTYSMDTNILVLLPEKPYRYVPIVNLQEWMADLLRK